MLLPDSPWFDSFFLFSTGSVSLPSLIVVIACPPSNEEEEEEEKEVKENDEEDDGRLPSG